MYSIILIWPAYLSERSDASRGHAQALGLKTAAPFVALWIGALIWSTGQVDQLATTLSNGVQRDTTAEHQ